jgi:hypothetical protein
MTMTEGERKRLATNKEMRAERHSEKKVLRGSYVDHQVDPCTQCDYPNRIVIYYESLSPDRECPYCGYTY